MDNMAQLDIVCLWNKMQSKLIILLLFDLLDQQDLSIMNLLDGIKNAIFLWPMSEVDLSHLVLS